VRDWLVARLDFGVGVVVVVVVGVGIGVGVGVVVTLLSILYRCIVYLLPSSEHAELARVLYTRLL